MLERKQQNTGSPHWVCRFTMAIFSLGKKTQVYFISSRNEQYSRTCLVSFELINRCPWLLPQIGVSNFMIMVIGIYLAVNVTSNWLTPNKFLYGPLLSPSVPSGIYCSLAALHKQAQHEWFPVGDLAPELSWKCPALVDQTEQEWAHWCKDIEYVFLRRLESWARVRR